MRSLPRRRTGPRAWGPAPGPVLPLLTLALLAACLAPPPPILVDTPYGDVRASSREKADEIASLLSELAPRVRDLLPGSQDREIDVWVQDELRVYRFHTRPESVRGFTLLREEFSARRIHLQEDGQSPWYLSHELVHALIDSSWRTLPGILEEGLADVVAERLNANYAYHIRAHRLLNASSFSGGFHLHFAHDEPTASLEERDWPRRVRSFRARTGDRIPRALVPRLFETPRSELHEEWPEIPEAFYGVAWLIVSRIVERHGLEGLHGLCLRAEREGREIVPAAWIFEAADLDWDEFDADFLTACFGPGEIRAAAYLQSELFASLAIDVLRPFRPSFAGRRALFWYLEPALRLADGSEVQLRSIGPLMGEIAGRWDD